MKGVVFAIFFLAVFSVIFGIVRLRGSLYAQKNAASQEYTVTRTAQTGVSSPVSSVPDYTDVAALQAKDTDGDGLSDYDELNRYKTSPYLKDSDSDTFDDKTEIASGNDPNCPAGQDCAIAAPTPTTPTLGVGSTPSVTQLPLTAPPLAPPLQGGGTSALPPFSPETARAILKQGGLTEEQVNSFDDAALREIYDESLKNAPPTPDVTQLTPQQVRKLLQENGIAKEVLDTLDDATLKRIVEEAMKKQQ